MSFNLQWWHCCF